MLSILFLTLVLAMATASLALDSPDARPMPTTTTNRNQFRFIKRYSLWFESCKIFPETENNAAATTTTTTGQFVIFRLCDDPDEPSSCSNHQSIVTLEDYLLRSVKHQETAQKKFCRDCQNFRNAPAEYTSKCETCLYNEEMEENGYVDATEFALCQMISDDEPYLYAGPLCSEDGSQITIGVFADEDCTIPDPTKYVDDYLRDENGYGMKLSYALLRSVYENYNDFMECWDITFEKWDDDCPKDGISCKDPITGETKEVCDSLYMESLKCDFHPATDTTTEDTAVCREAHPNKELQPTTDTATEETVQEAHPNEELQSNHGIIWTRVIMATPIWIVLILLLRVLWVINTKHPALNYELVPVKTIVPEGTP